MTDRVPLSEVFSAARRYAHALEWPEPKDAAQEVLARLVSDGQIDGRYFVPLPQWRDSWRTLVRLRVRTVVTDARRKHASDAGKRDKIGGTSMPWFADVGTGGSADEVGDDPDILPKTNPERVAGHLRPLVRGKPGAWLLPAAEKIPAHVQIPADEVAAFRHLVEAFADASRLLALGDEVGAPPQAREDTLAMVRAIWPKAMGYQIDEHDDVLDGREVAQLLLCVKQSGRGLAEITKSRPPTSRPLPAWATMTELATLSAGTVLGRGGGQGAGRSVVGAVADKINDLRKSAGKQEIRDLQRILARHSADEFAPLRAVHK